ARVRAAGGGRGGVGGPVRGPHLRGGRAARLRRTRGTARRAAVPDRDAVPLAHRRARPRGGVRYVERARAAVIGRRPRAAWRVARARARMGAALPRRALERQEA